MLTVTEGRRSIHRLLLHRHQCHLGRRLPLPPSLLLPLALVEGEHRWTRKDQRVLNRRILDVFCSCPNGTPPHLRKRRFGLRWSSETRHIETIAEWPSLGRGREPKDMLLCAKCTCLRGLESYAKTLYNLPSSPARGNCCLAISRGNPSHGETVSSVTAGFRSAQSTFARHYR
jgi:hypothetical protein